MCYVLLVAYSESSAVGANVRNISKSASTSTHQQLFRLIATNNKMTDSRRGRDDWNEGWTGIAVSCCCVNVITGFFVIKQKCVNKEVACSKCTQVLIDFRTRLKFNTST